MLCRKEILAVSRLKISDNFQENIALLPKDAACQAIQVLKPHECNKYMMFGYGTAQRQFSLPYNLPQWLGIIYCRQAK